MPVEIHTDDGEARDRRKVRRSGSSTVVTLPPQVLQAAGIQEGQDVEVVTGLDGSKKITLRAVDAETEE